MTTNTTTAPANLVNQLASKFGKDIKDFGIYEIFIDSFNEFRMTSTYDVPLDYAAAIEAAARELTAPTQPEILTGVQEVNDYPYGRLQCIMKFSIEFKKGKGFRSVMQSINPKTGRLNAPKKSTYYHFMYMFREASTGHIKFGAWSAYGLDNIAKLITLLTVNNFTITEEESQDIWTTVICSIRANAQYSRLKEGVTVKELLETSKVKEMITLYGAKAPIKDLITIGFDVAAINELTTN